MLLRTPCTAVGWVLANGSKNAKITSKSSLAARQPSWRDQPRSDGCREPLSGQQDRKPACTDSPVQSGETRYQSLMTSTKPGWERCFPLQVTHEHDLSEAQCRAPWHHDVSSSHRLLNVSLQWYPPLPCLSGVRLQPQQIHLTCRESQLWADVSATMPWMWWEVVGCVSHFLALQTFLFTLHEVVWLLCEPRQWKHHSYLQQLLLWLDV